MSITETEILLNLNTGEVRTNSISPEKAFRFHENHTQFDSAAGWKQVGNLGIGCSQQDIEDHISRAKAIYIIKPK